MVQFLLLQCCSNNYINDIIKHVIFLLTNVEIIEITLTINATDKTIRKPSCGINPISALYVPIPSKEYMYTGVFKLPELFPIRPHTYAINS